MPVHESPIGILGKIVKNARVKKQIPLKELAEHLDVTPGAISLFESGRRTNLSEKKVQKAFHYLGANEELVHDLFVINDMHKRELEFKRALEEKCDVVHRADLEAIGLSKEDLHVFIKSDFEKYNIQKDL